MDFMACFVLFFFFGQDKHCELCYIQKPCAFLNGVQSVEFVTIGNAIKLYISGL